MRLGGRGRKNYTELVFMTTIRKPLLIFGWLLFQLVLVAGCSNHGQSQTPTASAIELSNQPYPTLSNTLPELIVALTSPNAEVRIGAARRIASFGTSAVTAVPALSRNLQDENSEVRRATIDALSAIGEGAKPAVPNLIVLLLTDSAVQPRRQAAIALGKIGDISSVPALAQCLSDQDSGVAIFCAKSIAMLTGQEFPDLHSTGYALNNEGVPVIVVTAKEWWQENGQYEIWIDMESVSP